MTYLRTRLFVVTLVALASVRFLSAVPLPEQGEDPKKAEAPKGMTTATSPDGRLVATAVENVVSVAEAQTQKLLRKMAGHQGRVTTVAFSPDGKVLVSGGADATVHLYDVMTGKEIRTMRGKNGVVAVVFSTDGKTLTVHESDKTVRKLDMATGKVIEEK